MNQVELIRARIVRGQAQELMKLRQFVSMTRENNAVLERMQGKAGELLLAKVTDLILRELGHKTKTPPSDSNSGVRRAISKQ